MNFKMTKLGGLRTALLAAIGALLAPILFGSPIVRSRTGDVAFTYRMGAGFPGDINRTHPFSVLPGLINTTTPPRNYGDPLLINTADNTYRGVLSTDQSATAINIGGVTVRPYPTQQQSGGMSSALGAATPPTSGVFDVLREGYIMAKLPSGSTVTKGGTVYIWCAANSGAHVQGALEPAASAGNTVPVANAMFTGPCDANGVVEIEVRAA